MAVPENSRAAALTPVTPLAGDLEDRLETDPVDDRARDELAVGEDTADAHAGSLLPVSRMHENGRGARRTVGAAGNDDSERRGRDG